MTRPLEDLRETRMVGEHTVLGDIPVWAKERWAVEGKIWGVCEEGTSHVKTLPRCTL